jgi:subtilase family serine protease
MRRSKLALGCVLAFAATAGPSALAAQSQPARRIGFVPRLPAGTSFVGAVDPSTPIHVDVALQTRDPAALHAFATEVATPGSSLYRAYVTPAQFAQRFGPTSAQIQAVDSSLQAHGLTPGQVSANGLSIPVSATAGQLQRAFSLSLERVLLPSHTAAIVNTVAPLLDANVASLVQGVVGLSTLSAPHPLLERPQLTSSHALPHVVTGGPQPCSAARTAAPGQSAYTTDQTASAYNFAGFYQSGDTGAGQTIALYELEPYDPNDIAAYQSCYGTHAAVSTVKIDGGAGSGPGSGEAALDIEQAIGLAPGANFLVYEGPNSNSSGPGSGYYDTWSAIVSQDRARVVSASWGQCEPLESASDAAAEGTLFQEAAAQGQTITSASGDNGSEDCFSQTPLPDGGLAVDDPSSQPFVTAVGGTSMSALGPPPTETVWNNGGNPVGGLLGLQPGAGGGGISSRWGMPLYQSDAPSWLHVAQSRARETPDVSADADPNTGYLIYYNGSGQAQGATGWQGIGGTSAAAPVWAAAIALVDASRTCGGAMVGFANPALYKVAASAYAQDFNDITRGNNDFTGTNGGKYGAASGYDMASGLGSPNGIALEASLCQHATRVGAPAVLGASVSGVGHSRPNLRVTVAAGLDAPALSRVAIRLPNGLHFAHQAGRVTVAGPGGRPVSFKASVSGGVLKLALARTQSRVTITVRYAAITATRKEAAAVRSGHQGKVPLSVTVTDAHGLRTRLTASVRPR